MAKADSRAFQLLGLAALLAAVYAQSNKYQKGDKVPLFANKVGPFANPSEQYEYYALPFCAPKDIERKSLGFGEVLQGDRQMKTKYHLDFRESFKKKELCEVKLSKKQMRKFRDAIDEDYYFEFIYDDLPIWGFIGEKETKLIHGKNETLYFLFTHYMFEMTYSDDGEVVEVSWSHDPDMRYDLTNYDEQDDHTVSFYYSAKWTRSESSREHVDAKSIPEPEHLEIRWFAIFNSIVTVLLLTGFMATILIRVLKNDFMRYARSEEEGQLDAEESGWKLVHGDVFRFPNRKELFCAILGNGAQLLCMCVGVLFLACLGLYTKYNRGAILVAALLIFALTSGINGYVAASMYTKMQGENWVWNLISSYFLFLGPFFIVGTILNFVAVAYGSSTALPFGTVVIILLILTLVSFPLNIVGGISGRNFCTPFDAPCRTTKLPREIPPLPWYHSSFFRILAAGILPFSAIYIELYYVFASVWGHKLYSLYGILTLVFLILLIVTCFIVISLTYFQLAAEDHHWWWRAVLCGSSTGAYLMAYCVYYYKFKARMYGVLQTSFFFGYMGVTAFGFSLILGTVGFFSSLSFVRYIYRSIKCD